MSTKLADRVKETTTTTGTGAYSLGGAATGFRAFSSAFVTTDVVYYCCEDGINWEVGEGTLTTGTPWTLARTTIHASSNSNIEVNWGAGQKRIFCTGSAKAVANYTEEGTFTPTLTAATPGTLSCTYFTQNGTYVRTGRLVNFVIEMELDTLTIGTGTGDARINGIPFLDSRVLPVGYFNGVCLTWGTSLDPTLLWHINGSTSMTFYENGKAAPTASIPIGSFTSGDLFYISGTFII